MGNIVFCWSFELIYIFGSYRYIFDSVRLKEWVCVWINVSV